MKKLLVAMIIIWGLSACDPDVPGEGVNLPEMKFGFKVFPDTSHIKLGDTLTISASIPRTLTNGVRITDGKATINCAQGYYSEIPVIDPYKGGGCYVNECFIPQLINGEFYITSSNLLLDVIAIPIGDSLKVSYKFIALKVGTYSLSVFSKFFEGTQGKTRTNPYFDVVKNNGEELWQVPGMPAITPDNPAYKSIYYFAVTE